MAEIKLHSQVPGAVAQREPVFNAAARGFWEVRVQYDLKKTVTGNTEKQRREKKVEKRMREYGCVIYC